MDGANALLKGEIKKKWIKHNARQPQSVFDVVTFSRKKATRQHVACPNTKRIVLNHFCEVKKDDVDRSQLFECHIIDGSHKTHQVQYVSSRDFTLVEF